MSGESSAEVVVSAAWPSTQLSSEELRHHGDREVGEGLLDFAVNVHQASMPRWLQKALQDSLDDLARYPDPTLAEQALARRHGRHPADVLATSGAAEAFTLIARLRPWRHSVVVHPQFTEPDVALATAGHRVEHVSPELWKLVYAQDELDQDAALSLVPETADLVIVGNPTNPTGLRHPAEALRALVRPGRLVVVDEAFCDDDVESLAAMPQSGLVVIRSLTKLWAIAGLRAGYVLAEPSVVQAMRDLQPPWSVSTPAAAAMVACSTDEAQREAQRRVADIERWREHLQRGLTDLGVAHLRSTAPFVLARPGGGVHERLRERGIAVRRGDTVPGLDGGWVRIAVREPSVTDTLLGHLDAVVAPRWRTSRSVP